MSLSASPAPFLLFFLFLLPLPPCQPESQRSDPSMNPDPRTALPSIFPSSSVLPSLSNDNSTSPSIGDKCDEVTVCKPGILLPVWYPENPGVGYQVARAVVYFLSLMYMFLGVSIIADRFMASIEVITSQEKEVTITMPNGETSLMTVRIWNETVSNLTLMALGSSAPEILLSVIEVCGHEFKAGQLGPGTIVGSAAFNMFVIIGICVWVIPNGQSRKIKHLRVFFITAFWSIFAYIWLYLILSIISPGVVEVWEALVTLLFFPVCVILAWIADRRLLFYKYMGKRYRADKRHGIVVETEGDVTVFCFCCLGGLGENTFYVDYRTEDGSANAGSDYEYTEGTLVFKPGETCKEIKIGIIDDDIFEEDEHFFVRLLNLRVGDAEGMFESDEVGATPKARLVEPLVATVTILDDDHAGIFTFSERMVRVSESVGTMELTVVRNSGARGTVILPYHTESGTAKAGEDFEEARGELEFTNDQTSLTLGDEFMVHNALIVKNDEQAPGLPVTRITNWTLLVCAFIVEFCFDCAFPPDCSLVLTALLFLSTRPPLSVFFTALLLSQEGTEGQMTAEEEEARRIAEMGKPILGEHSRLEVVIEESYEFKSTVDKLIKKTNLALVIGTHSWREQFVEAVTVSADTFASKVAAIQDQHADASVGNVTGSNAVNVFLGIGVAWSVAAVYWRIKGKEFQVDPGSLAFSVTLFTIFAFICMFVLLFRRRPSIGGELGGPKVSRLLTTLLFLGLWFLYILFSSLEAYCHINGF
ncbi:sodium/calcium exchanger 2-like [Neolamprologus brichardi]|uniref:sodium/calcium exchanger 2-like n=1 Tax=Neolamprologus brichardi TaxID=32507 RepID=UPI001643AA48|nr:sodium/calcium exchanger 2-like [Neolamprologus brichardi]